MDDQTGDPADEVVGEFRDNEAVLLVQQIEAPVQMDHRQVPMGGHEPQHILKLVRCIGVELGGQARLGEAECREFEQCVVPIGALGEQGTDDPEYMVLFAGFVLSETTTAWGTIHDTPSTIP